MIIWILKVNLSKFNHLGWIQNSRSKTVHFKRNFTFVICASHEWEHFLGTPSKRLRVKSIATPPLLCKDLINRYLV